MDKFLEIVRNKWFRFGLAFLTIIYMWFIGYVAWLAFAYCLTPTNNASLFALYFMINFIFGALMYFTRKTIVTRILCVLIPFECVALMLTAFGNWLIIIPPVVISMLCFFLAANPENLKIIMGTMYLILFVVGALAYGAFLKFDISLFYVITGEEITPQTRDEDSYLLSTDGTYRLVSYTRKTEAQTSTSYYIELAGEDSHLWFLDCYRVYGCKKILATINDREVNPTWISDTKLRIDGKVRDVEELFAQEEEEPEESTSAAGSDDADTTEKTSQTTAEDAEETTLAE